MVDVRAFEAHHIGNQAVGFLQGVVGGCIHRGIAVPAEGFQRSLYKAVGIGVAQAAIGFCAVNQRQCFRGKDVAARQNVAGLLAQSGVGNQLQAQQRGEYAKRVGQQCGIAHGAKRGGMHGHAGHRQVVVAHGLHAHDGKQAAQGRQFFGGADADGAVALHIQALQLTRALHLGAQAGVGLQGLRIHIGHQLDQTAVLRHLFAVHLGHGTREAGADFVAGDKGGRGLMRGAHDARMRKRWGAGAVHRVNTYASIPIHSAWCDQY